MNKKDIKSTYINLVNQSFDNLKNKEQIDISEDIIVILQQLILLTEKEELTEEEEKIMQEGLKIVTKIMIPVRTKGMVDQKLNELKD